MDRLSVPELRVSQDLKRVSGVLNDMLQEQALSAEGAGLPGSPGIPPAVFGAGGPM